MGTGFVSGYQDSTGNVLILYGGIEILFQDGGGHGSEVFLILKN